MIKDLPLYISILFGLTTSLTLILAVLLIKNSNQKNKLNLLIIGFVLWLIVQAIFTLNNVYSDINFLPPKIILFGIIPMLIVIISLFLTSNGREFIDSLPLKQLIYLNIIRILVEIILYLLFLHKSIPQLMTFEGRNFDIIAGISAPIVAYLYFNKKIIERKSLLIWNFICLALLINIIINALLSVPSPFQKFAFDQPNIAVISFPFSWLPTFIVPIVLFGHLASIRQLWKQKNKL